MKVNAKYYNAINTTPKEVQETKYGKVQIYSLNDFPTLCSANTSKGKFHIWSNNGGTDYKLLIEDNYFSELHELYTKEINELWLEFYDKLDKSKKAIMKKIFLPISLAVLSIMIGLSFLPESLETVKTVASWILMIGVVVVSVKVNKKINNGLMESKNHAVSKIQEVITEKRFNELIDLQDEFIKKYYKEQYVAMYGEESFDLDEKTEELDENKMLESNDKK